MSNTQPLLSFFYLKLDGQPARGDLMSSVQEVTVESSLHLPDVATLTLLDQELRWADGDDLLPGKKLVVQARSSGDSGDLFDGEIVEIEPRFERGMKKLIVRAFDRLHRLGRGQYVRRFIQSTDGDVITKLAQEVGLKAKVGPTAEVHPYIIQANESNLSFLQRRAAALGYLLYVEGETLYCEAPRDDAPPISLVWEKELTEFRPRMSTLGQVNEVTARGWDPQQRQELVGQATTSTITPQVGTAQSGGDLAQTAFGITARQMVANRPVRSQEYARKLAQAVADRHAARFIEAEGQCAGDPRIVAGTTVAIANAGKRFSGSYFVTNAVHTMRPGDYTVHFSVSGLQPATLLSLLVPEVEAGIPAGLVIGIVTDNDDPEQQGRVKVKYPWLSAEVESDWARIVTLGGGPTRGICFLPEVQDEVLLGFELGDFDHPYVLGGLWNGQDLPPPPEKIQKLVDGAGRVLQRVIRTRAGNEIRFDEDSSGQQNAISVKTVTGYSLTLSDTQGIEISSPKGDLKLSSKGRIIINGTSGVEIKGSTVQIN